MCSGFGFEGLHRPERIYGFVHHPNKSYFVIFYRQPTWKPLHRGFRRTRSHTQRPVQRCLFVSVNPFHARHVWELVESKTRTYHERVGSGRTRGVGAGPGRTGRRQTSAPRGQASLVPPEASKTSLQSVSLEARSSKTLCVQVSSVRSRARRHHDLVQVSSARSPRSRSSTQCSLAFALTSSGLETRVNGAPCARTPAGFRNRFS